MPDGDRLTGRVPSTDIDRCVTPMSDTDDDGQADEYLTVAKGWGVTGHYHEYSYGPKLDRDGNRIVRLMGCSGWGGLDGPG